MRLNDRLDRVDTRLEELTTRTGTLERDVAGLGLRIAEIKVDFAAMQARFDTMDRRLGRIERRLELVEVPTASLMPAWRDQLAERGCRQLLGIPARQPDLFFAIGRERSKGGFCRPAYGADL